MLKGLDGAGLGIFQNVLSSQSILKACTTCIF